MNRRNFLRGLAAIVPATLLAKIALPQVEAAIVEAVEETSVMTEAESEFKSFGGYFAIGTSNKVYRPSQVRPNEWVTIDLDDET